MPKNRKRSPHKGAKSIAIRTKFKIGGRKSGIAANELSNDEVKAKLESVRKKDRNKLLQIMINRGLIT
jgi:hypothetical protein